MYNKTATTVIAIIGALMLIGGIQAVITSINEYGINTTEILVDTLPLGCGNITGAASNLCTIVDSDTTISNCSVDTSCAAVTYDSELAYIPDTDTNASTACSPGEFLNGDNSCDAGYLDADGVDSAYNITYEWWSYPWLRSKWLNTTLPLGEGMSNIDFVYPNSTYGDNLLIQGVGSFQGWVAATGGFYADNMSTSSGDIKFYNSTGGLILTLFDNGNATAYNHMCDAYGCIGYTYNATYDAKVGWGDIPTCSGTDKLTSSDGISFTCDTDLIGGGAGGINYWSNVGGKLFPNTTAGASEDINISNLDVSSDIVLGGDMALGCANITGAASNLCTITDTTIPDTDTNASTACAGTTTYLDGEGNCDDISGVYFDDEGDITCTSISGLSADLCDGSDADTTIPDTNASTACSPGEFLNGDGSCDAGYLDADGIDSAYNITYESTYNATYDVKVDRAGDTMTGALFMNNVNITVNASYGLCLNIACTRYIYDNGTGVVIQG